MTDETLKALGEMLEEAFRMVSGASFGGAVCLGEYRTDVEIEGQTFTIRVAKPEFYEDEA